MLININNITFDFQILHKYFSKNRLNFTNIGTGLKRKLDNTSLSISDIVAKLATLLNDF
jgi:hypothetical protein